MASKYPKWLMTPHELNIREIGDADRHIKLIWEALQELNRRLWDEFKEIHNIAVYGNLQRGQITAISSDYFACTLVEKTGTPSVNVYPIAHKGTNSLAGNVTPKLEVDDYIPVLLTANGDYKAAIVFMDGWLNA